MKRLFTVAAACAIVLTASAVRGSNAQERDAGIAAIVATVDQQRITDHIAAIDEPRSPFEEAQLHATTDYILAEFNQLGYDVQRDPATFRGEWRGADLDITSENVTAVKPGTQCPNRIFVVAGHYDSVPDSPGADDDASGTAGMLEIARVLADVDLPATVYFSGLTLEEPGLVGSRAMAAALASERAEVVGMYSLEMIGYTDEATDAEFILVLGNEASAPLLAAVEEAKAYVPELPIVTLAAAGNGESSPDTRRSDHAPFWDAGYQALLVSDTANFRNPNYHKPSDTLATLDMPFATNVARAMTAATVLYLTGDADRNGSADVCSAPLTATATPAPSDMVATATPPPAPTSTPATGVVLPDTGQGARNESARTGFALVMALVLAGGACAASGALFVRRLLS